MLNAIEERRMKREKEEIVSRLHTALSVVTDITDELDSLWGEDGISEDQVPAIWALEDASQKMEESLDFLNGNILLT